MYPKQTCITFSYYKLWKRNFIQCNQLGCFTLSLTYSMPFLSLLVVELQHLRYLYIFTNVVFAKSGVRVFYYNSKSTEKKGWTKPTFWSLLRGPKPKTESHSSVSVFVANLTWLRFVPEVLILRQNEAYRRIVW